MTPILSTRFPEIIVVAILAMLFAWIYALSMNSTVSELSPSMSSDITDSASTDLAVDLELSKSLEERRQAAPQPTVYQTKRAIPIWPALLFASAFLCGWLMRHLVRTYHFNGFRRATDTGTHPAMDHLAIDATEQSELHIAELDHRIKSLQQELESLVDVDKAFSVSSGSTSVEIEILRKKNIAKAEIIAALEDLVKENRDKWLQQDDTEAKMNQRIKELTDDLNAAMGLMRTGQVEKRVRDPLDSEL